nr:unnamed protein product [Callosobruchus chinensis]
MVITPTPQKPFGIVCRDTIGPFPKTFKGNTYAVTVQCELTKYVIIVPVPNKEAITVARAFVENLILIFGKVKEIRSDMGTDYKNELLEQVCKLLKINQKFSTAYHHESIVGCERNHRVLNEFVRMYVNDTHTDWDKWVQFYSFCYNTTPGTYHDYTPFELVFGRQNDLPITLTNNTIDPIYNIDAYYQELRYRLQISHKRARDFLLNVKEKRKAEYDKRAKDLTFQPGDLVTVSNENRSKFDPWFKGPFPIVSCDDVNCNIRVGDKNVTVHKNRVEHFFAGSEVPWNNND